MSDLQLRFQQLVMPLTEHPEVSYELWLELEKSYNQPKRFYHNLTHLENLFLELNDIRDRIQDWETLSFSVFYHDYIYKVRRQDNEEQSADFAVEILKKIDYPIDKIERCRAQIIATKSHEVLADKDANLFTDADLSILGKDWNTYQAYFQAIREEYKIYPNLIYKPARKKVLHHFLEMPKLFKTPHFFDKYEKQARANISKELKMY